MGSVGDGNIIFFINALQESGAYPPSWKSPPSGRLSIKYFITCMNINPDPGIFLLYLTQKQG
jgi:hypothetical protein